jgi:hypothetical protein
MVVFSSGSRLVCCLDCGTHPPNSKLKSPEGMKKLAKIRKKHGAHFDEKISGIRCARSYRILRDGSLEGPFPQALRARLRSHRPSGTINRPKSSLTSHHSTLDYALLTC